MCFEGSNFTPKDDSGLISCSLAHYKNQFRDRCWVLVCEAAKLQTAMSYVRGSTQVFERMSEIHQGLEALQSYETTVHTQHLEHKEVGGEKHWEEHLEDDEGYYTWKYRGVTYLLHKDRKKVYMKALLNNRRENHAV